MAPRRRLVLAVGAALLVLAAVVAVLLVRDPAGAPGEGPGGGSGDAAVDQARPGPVLLVPGYGGGTAGLQVLAAALVAQGREAVVVPAVDGGTGDLADQAEQLDAAARAALDAGAPSVDVVGYSAGGVVARVWLASGSLPGRGGPVRRVVTLGTPHQGTDLAALAGQLAPAQCPLACRQLAPGSDLLVGLPAVPGQDRGTRWTTLWSAADEVSTPPATSSALPGALSLPLQAVCPGATTSHGQLPTDPLVVGLLERLLGAGPPDAAPGPAECAALTARGEQLLSS